MRIANIIQDSIVDGPGLRATVFAQGCPRVCEGCHNPEAQPVMGGYEITAEEILKRIEKNPLISGITLSGGEPFSQAIEMAVLSKGARERGLDVAAYTGYLFEELLSENAPDGSRALLKEIDILVDGPFVKALRSLGIGFRGSSNQRIIDVPKSLAEGKAVCYEGDGWNL